MHAQHEKPFRGPRQLAPAVMGHQRMSRHTAMMAGSRSEHFWIFLRNPRFWVIGAMMTAVFLAVFWEVKDLPALPRVDLASFRSFHAWKQTFFVEEEPAVVENGKVVKPGEKFFTVPTKLEEKK